MKSRTFFRNPRHHHHHHHECWIGGSLCCVRCLFKTDPDCAKISMCMTVTVHQAYADKEMKEYYFLLPQKGFCLFRQWTRLLWSNEMKELPCRQKGLLKCGCNRTKEYGWVTVITIWRNTRFISLREGLVWGGRLWAELRQHLHGPLLQLQLWYWLSTQRRCSNL